MSWLRRNYLAVAMAAALLINAPALYAGFCGDERLQLAALENPPGDRPGALAPLHLWRFSSGTEAEASADVASGWMEWYRVPFAAGTKMKFLRPLPSALFQAEHELFGRTAVGYHAISLLLLLVLILLVDRLYRAVLPRSLVPLATIVLATAGHQWEGAGIICARHMLLAAVFGSLALSQHIAWRDQRQARGAWWSCVWLSCAALCGEAVLQVFTFFVAYELLGRRERLHQRIVALVPAGAIVALFVACHVGLGYGARGNGYLQLSVRDLAAASPELARRAVALIGEALTSVPCSYGLERPFTMLGVTLILVAVIVRLVRRADADIARVAAWLAVGAALAIAPVTLGQIGARYLTVPGIGSSVLIALLISGLWQWRARCSPTRRWIASTVAIGVASLYFALSAGVAIATLTIWGRHTRAELADLDRWEADWTRLAGLERRPVIALRVPPTFSLNTFRAHTGARLRVWPVSTIDATLQVVRRSPRTLDISIAARPADAGSGAPPVHSMAWPRGCEAAKLAAPTTPWFRVTVTGCERDQVTSVRLDFTEALDEGRFVFTCWNASIAHMVECPPI